MFFLVLLGIDVNERVNGHGNLVNVYWTRMIRVGNISDLAGEREIRKFFLFWATSITSRSEGKHLNFSFPVLFCFLFDTSIDCFNPLGNW